MLFMNDYDIEIARSRFTRTVNPNRLALAIVVDRLREWADGNSDGWAYWPKPAQAAKSAMEHIASSTSIANREQENHDITDEELRAAVRPIKAFLTRYKVSRDDRELILRATEEN